MIGEQQLFRRLSIFVGGCTLEAVEAVCYKTQQEALSALGEIASLLDKSLLQQVAYEGEARLMMLETIREYGLECLRESGEANRIQSEHARYYLTLAEELEPQYFGAQATEVLAQLERESENLRATLKCLAESGERELALRLAGALWWFWYARGHLNEGRHWLEQLLSNSEGIAPAVRAKALIHVGWIAYQQEDSAHAEVPLNEGLSLYRQLGNREKTGTALYRLGLIAWDERDFVATQALAEEALKLFNDVANKEGIADSLLVLSFLGMERGDQWAMTYALHGLARVILLQGDSVTAQALTEESLAISIVLGNLRGIVSCLEQLAEISVALGEPERATRFWGTEEALRDRASAMGYIIKHENYEKMESERSVKAVYSHLGDKVFAAAWAEGRAMTPEQVLAARESVVIPLISSQSGESPTPSVKSPSFSPDGLTAREVEVLSLVACGLTNAKVAELLFISPRTVNSHLITIYSKIGVSTRSAATRYAIEHKLV